jgi:hypothetical protein
MKAARRHCRVEVFDSSAVVLVDKIYLRNEKMLGFVVYEQ